MLHRRAPSLCRSPLRCLLGVVFGVVITAADPGVGVADEFSEFARISMRLGFLQQTWHRDLVEQDPVQTQVMDAQVSGQQMTSVAVRLSAQPGSQMAQLNLHGLGQVQSTTVGVTREARVDSLGSHSFQLTKPVYFDGRQFLTRRCYGHVTASTQPVAVRTVVSGVPLIGRFGEQIAWSETLRRQPTTNSIVVRQVADDVVPEFDCKVEKELSAANRSWAKMRRQFGQLLPQHQVDWQAESTSDGLSLKVGFREAAGSHAVSRPLHHTTLRPDPQSREDLVVTVSDGMINELLSALPLKGLTVTDAVLQELQYTDVGTLFQDGRLQVPSGLRDAMSAPATVFSLRFAEDTPLEVLFEQGVMEIVLRFRVLLESGEESDLHRMTLSINGSDGGPGQWSLQIADVEVMAENEDVDEDSITEIVRQQARSMLLDQPPAVMSRVARLQEQTGLPDLQLHGIRSRDGVLRVAFQLVSKSDGT